tara:strand:+ start:3574 stop:3921 length:348 start_codon:yes stop_codon:yes gene_type:complete
MKKLTFCFDIDNTICSTNGRDYNKSKPKKKVIKMINTLYSKGHIIKLNTARFMGRSNDNFKFSKKKASQLTKRQLKLWGLKYHKIFFGKPSADIYIDDKSYCYNERWLIYLKKYL